MMWDVFFLLLLFSAFALLVLKKYKLTPLHEGRGKKARQFSFPQTAL